MVGLTLTMHYFSLAVTMVSAAKKREMVGLTLTMHYFSLAVTMVSAAKKQGDGRSHTDHELLFTSCDHGQRC